MPSLLGALWLALASFAASSEPAYVLEVVAREEVERNLDPTKKTDPVEEAVEFRLEAILGVDFIEYRRAEGKQRILDFAGEQVYFREEGEAGFTVASIYTDLGFRLYEFQNRLFVDSLMDKVASRAKRSAPAYPEHLFSLRSETPAKIERRALRRSVSYSFERDLLFRHSVETIAAPPEALRRFLVFLRNAYGTHPDILDALAELDGLPRQIEIFQFDREKKRYVLNLKSLKERSYQLNADDFEIVARAGAAEVQEISRRALGAPLEARESRIDRLVIKASRLAESGRELDAMLLFFEHTLCTGEDLPAEFFPHRAAIMADPEVGTLFAALDLAGEEGAERAKRRLQRLEKKVGPDARRSLRIFLGNTLTTLGENAEAKALFLRTLRENPFIAGAWKDLGDIYYGEYDAYTAWLCWDTGRSLQPSPKLFQQVYEFERSLERKHPEFFLK